MNLQIVWYDFFVCFPIVIDALQHGFNPDICFTCVVNVPRSYVPVHLAMHLHLSENGRVVTNVEKFENHFK